MRTSTKYLLIVAAVVPSVAILALRFFVDEQRYGLTDGVPITIAVSRGVLIVGVLLQLLALLAALVATWRRTLHILITAFVVVISVGYLVWALPFVSRLPW